MRIGLAASAAMLLVIAALLPACPSGGAFPAAGTLPPPSQGAASGAPRGPLPPSSATGSAPASLDPPECADYAAAVCGRLDACVPWRMRKTYGDLTTCQQRVGVDCAARADGARWYAAQVSLPVPALGPRQKSCAQSIAQASCNDFEDQIASNDCDPVPGKTPDGYLCASGKECQSAHCGKENPDAEAKCVRVAAIGASCGNGIAMCDTGASCTLGKCVKFGGEGASCIDAVPPCAGFLTCFGGKCAKAAAIGERCGDGLPSCVDEANDSITCAAGVCTVAAFAKAGEACDLAAGPFCEGGGFCQGDLVGPNGAVEFVGTHRCLAPSQDGNACDGNRMKGPGCLAPSSCDLETNSCQPPVYTAMMTRTQITRVKP